MAIFSMDNFKTRLGGKNIGNYLIRNLILHIVLGENCINFLVHFPEILIELNLLFKCRNEIRSNISFMTSHVGRSLTLESCIIINPMYYYLLLFEKLQK